MPVLLIMMIIIIPTSFCWAWGLWHTVKVTFGKDDEVSVLEERWGLIAFVGWITFGGSMIHILFIGPLPEATQRVCTGPSISDCVVSNNMPWFSIGFLAFLCHMGTHYVLMFASDWLRNRRLSTYAKIVK